MLLFHLCESRKNYWSFVRFLFGLYIYFTLLYTVLVLTSKCLALVSVSMLSSLGNVLVYEKAECCSASDDLKSVSSEL